MFFIGPSANILPYLLVILVSLVYYIEGGTGKSLPIITEKSIEITNESNAVFADYYIDNYNIDDDKTVVYNYVKVSPLPELQPFTNYGLLLIPNGPHRAPPCNSVNIIA